MTNDSLTDFENEPAAGVVRRIRLTALVSYFVFALYALISSGFQAFLGLTCSAAIVMINFLWLEEIVQSLLQPTPNLRPWRLILRAIARFVLLGVALTVTIYIARFDALSVLLGFSIVVVGIMGEALYSMYRSFAG